ncbi:uncharacterized protein I206_105977 [Kwoniella pini CBS 10737]|uniref:G-patch domain-containing protein n=1 Tax=Kwoniella pini CBS 10737 TaxID=1296096 RepID=A0A1B9I0P8_9TREE|nr:uncharacterized protein I206_04800 [Kwoniella pini CBS 10737]OCF49113.1 hypothetical protein I206_04800 [Kwoniella pini CBS 10737]
MTIPRPYRAGLGFPEAVIISSTSSAGPSRLRNYQEDDQEIDSNQDNLINDNIKEAYSYRNIKKQIQDENELTKETIWNEWNINPALHGPSKINLPPKFILSSNLYDDLGRSISDGINITINKKSKKKVENEIEKEDGNKLSNWYKDLSSKTNSNLNSQNNSPQEKLDEDESDNEIQIISYDEFKGNDNEIKLEPNLEIENRKILKINSKDWFIRRSLLNSPLTNTSNQPIRTTSISRLLNINPDLKKKINVPRYVLGPENKGYKILKDKLGWHGGGLGKPPGWDDLSTQPSRSSQERISQSHDNFKNNKNIVSEMELDDNGHPVVDLTISSDEEEDENEDEEKQYGPGRIAPISTILKLDKKGLGHKHGLKSKNHSITHTHNQIEMARKKAKFGNSKDHGKGLELGKKGKSEWKVVDKLDRDERMAIKAALG